MPPVVRWDLNYLGSIASLVGLLMTLLGFLATLRKLRKSQEVAQQALREVAERFVHNQIANCVSTMREVGRYCQDLNWPRAMDRAEDLHAMLAATQDDKALSDSDRQTVAAQINDLQLLIRDCRRKMDCQDVTPLTETMLAFIVKATGKLAALDARLKNKVMGYGHV